MKNKLLFGLLTLSIAVTSIAVAGDLTIINNTNHDSTSVINGGACSNLLGSEGVTKAHSSNVVPEKIINKACMFNRINCRAEVHMTNDCSGPVVAIVTFDVRTGIKNVTLVNQSEGYIASGSGFTASIEGGPAKKNWLQTLFNI